MRMALLMVGLLVPLTLSVGLTPVVAAEEVEEEAAWTVGTVTEIVEGESLTVTVPGEDGEEGKSMSFVLTEETEFYEKVEAGMDVEFEHKKEVALYVQAAEEK